MLMAYFSRLVQTTQAVTDAIGSLLYFNLLQEFFQYHEMDTRVWV